MDEKIPRGADSAGERRERKNQKYWPICTNSLCNQHIIVAHPQRGEEALQ